MGSGDWFKTIISLRKSKGSSKKAKGSPASKKQTALKNYTGKDSNNLTNGTEGSDLVSPGVSVETVAATMIQTAFRAYLARKSLRRLKGCAKLKVQIQGHSVKDQASRAVSCIHKWSKIQAEVRARRIGMVTEDRIRRKKLENQLKLEAKLHDLEFIAETNDRWNGVVVLKPWRKPWQGYIIEKKQPLSAKDPWPMPFLISGELTLIKGLVTMNLTKPIGVGAGRNAGLPLAHGKAVSSRSPLTPRKLKQSSSQRRLKRTRTHQHQKHQFQLKLLWLMQK